MALDAVENMYILKLMKTSEMFLELIVAVMTEAAACKYGSATTHAVDFSDLAFLFRQQTMEMAGARS